MKFSKLSLIAYIGFCMLSVLTVVSCSASKHVGVNYVAEPSLKEQSEETWLIYWQDVFDSRSGKVSPPTSEYPDVARKAYQKARFEWDAKVREARLNSWIVGGLILVGLSTILPFIIIESI